MSIIKINKKRFLDILSEAYRHVLYFDGSREIPNDLVSKIGFCTTIHEEYERDFPKIVNSIQYGFSFIYLGKNPKSMVAIVSKINKKCVIEHITIDKAIKVFDFIGLSDLYQRDLSSLKEYKRFIDLGVILRDSYRDKTFDRPNHIIDNIYIGSELSLRKSIFKSGIMNIIKFVNKEDDSQELIKVYEGYESYPEAICIGYRVNDNPDDKDRMIKALRNISKRINPENKTLICCGRGISRSATAVIYYLMISKKFTLHQSFDLVKRKRHIVSPLNTWIGILVDLEKKLFGLDTPSIAPHWMTASYKDYILIKDLIESK